MSTITPGVNEYDHPGGLHHWRLRMEWLRPILPPAVPGPPAFQGIVYDECEHMQLSNNKFSNQAATFDKPFLVNTHGMWSTQRGPLPLRPPRGGVRERFQARPNRSEGDGAELTWTFT